MEIKTKHCVVGASLMSSRKPLDKGVVVPLTGCEGKGGRVGKACRRGDKGRRVGGGEKGRRVEKKGRRGVGDVALTG